MKNIKKYILLLFGITFLVSCQEEDKNIGDLEAPTNLVVEAVIQGQDANNPYGDGTGVVNFKAHADNAISYKYAFSDGNTKNVPSGEFAYAFNTNGIIEYTVTVIAFGKGGVSTTTTTMLSVFSDFSDLEAVDFLTDGTSKEWYWSASEPGHLGVGPNSTNETQNYFPFWYQAAPWEKAASPDSSCLYDNVLTFSVENGQLKFVLDNGGKTFFNTAFEGVVGGSAGTDMCYDYDVSGVKNVTLSPSTSVVTMNPDAITQTRGTLMTFSDNGFMGYYIGQSSYEILSITRNRMEVRAIMGNDPGLAWYHTFTTTRPVQNPTTDYTNLVWSDEFDVDGAPDATKWGYDLGAGGWGNQEAQNYTNSAANSVVSNGNLVITAINSGGNYTSARLKSENKFEFTYGKVEVRAKLPSGGGTWPAIWMLGANYDQAGFTWPACGEIDIMEHKGNVPNVIHGTLHYPGNSGGNGNGNTTTITGASTDFHIYKTIWSPTSIQIFVDDVLFHSVPNSNAIPFNHDFFLILNVAMGGTFGGAIDPGFTQSSMEVDYVRVYQ